MPRQIVNFHIFFTYLWTNLELSNAFLWTLDVAFGRLASHLSGLGTDIFGLQGRFLSGSRTDIHMYNPGSCNMITRLVMFVKVVYGSRTTFKSIYFDDPSCLVDDVRRADLEGCKCKGWIVKSKLSSQRHASPPP